MLKPLNTVGHYSAYSLVLQLKDKPKRRLTVSFNNTIGYRSFERRPSRGRQGEKEMLIEKIRDVYREYINPVVSAEAITTIEAKRPAANAFQFETRDMQARRHRRQRRLNRSVANRIDGWAVRSW
jgi:hypothetical protein